MQYTTLIYCRFLKGAVDSEDLPLSLSREKAQNSNLVRRIKDVVTRKFLRFLSDEAKNKPDNYREFYLEYHMFLKEGEYLVVCIYDTNFLGSFVVYLCVLYLYIYNDRSVPRLCLHGAALQVDAVRILRRL